MRYAYLDPVMRVAHYLLDNIGHLTRPGIPSFDRAAQRWLVPICLRTEHGDVVVGDAEVDTAGHLVYAPSKEELVKRADEVTAKLRTAAEAPAAASA